MTDLRPEWQQRRLAKSSVNQNDQRSRYQRDKARVLHSAAFRRLQSKTQVLGIGLNDFHRTRLTHSIESAQIGSGINAQLRQRYPKLSYLLNDQLIEALCLAHDIGHPPFGHGGETALNYMMAKHGGFEGNGQTFRILAKLEPYTESHGMNLTRRTLLGVMKYPALQSVLCQKSESPKGAAQGRSIIGGWAPAKGIYDDDASIYDWVLMPLSSDDRKLFTSLKEPPKASKNGRTAWKSIDCAIMELADDIAYSVHDLEDAIVLGIISEHQWRQQVLQPLLADAASPYNADKLQELTTALFAAENYHRKKAIGALVNGFVTAIELQHNDAFAEPLLAYQAILPERMALLLNLLKKFVYHNVILHPSVQRSEFKGQQIVMALFDAFASEPERLLPEGTKQKWRQANQQDTSSYRVISDYLSGMTDDFAMKIHGDLFATKPVYSENYYGE